LILKLGMAVMSNFRPIDRQTAYWLPPSVEDWLPEEQPSYKGRAPTAMAKADDVLTLLKNGMGASEVARQLKIGRASAYRIIEAAGGK
jgi:DNA invertase Pin-like site-specific DNA recombinase